MTTNADLFSSGVPAGRRSRRDRRHGSLAEFHAGVKPRGFVMVSRSKQTDISGIFSMPLKKLWISIAATASSLCVTQALAFEIYGFIPYQSRIDGGKVVQGRPSLGWFSGIGIKPIDVVYDNRLLDFPKGRAKAQATINNEKIQKVAKANDENESQLVSLDLESWDRHDPMTPSKILQTIEIYRKAHPGSVIGLYATVPQNTYGWKSKKRESYESLNSKYADVAEAVDYFSPSLYNYSRDDFASWRESARYNISAAKKYSSTKKVFPYITPEVSENGATRWLTYDEMMQRLEGLRSLGADGCIVWASSQTRDSAGKPPILDPSNGWLKAVSDFSRKVGQE